MKGKEIPEQEAEHSKWMGGNFFYFSPRREISLYIYICVCVCVCVYMCVYIYVCVCVYIYIYIYIYVFNWRLLIGVLRGSAIKYGAHFFDLLLSPGS